MPPPPTSRLGPDELTALAQTLEDARRQGREIERLTRAHPALTLADGYAIQAAGIRLRTAAGDQVIGWKMGLTSQAKREQVGLDAPICGVLTTGMFMLSPAETRLPDSIHPKVEPEVAFAVTRRLAGKITVEEALAACSGVMPALEIIDSRFLDFKYFSLPDVVADNCSAYRLVVGNERTPPADVDLADLAMVLEIDGARVAEGSTRAISGHPARSLVDLCALLDERGLAIEPPALVLAGASTQAIALRPGNRVSLTVEGLGRAALTFLD